MSEESDTFRRMAERIEHNAKQPFGGACVIVLPDSQGAVEVLVLDASFDPAQFVGLVKTRLEALLYGMEQALKGRR